jgi:hypothetical protein
VKPSKQDAKNPINKLQQIKQNFKKAGKQASTDQANKL